MDSEASSINFSGIEGASLDIEANGEVKIKN
jgi:hypothetical protein